jgi:excisionase family DNA binding protein
MKRLTVADAAQRLQRNPELIRRWLREGRLHGEQFGREWLIVPSDLERFAAKEPERRRPR